MKIFRLPDNRLVVPKRVEAEGMVGDAYVPIDAEDPDYAKWEAWLERMGQDAEPVGSWPQGPAIPDATR